VWNKLGRVLIYNDGNYWSIFNFHPSQKIISKSLKGYLPNGKIPLNVASRNRFTLKAGLGRFKPLENHGSNKSLCKLIIFWEG